jgi:hypothetical protein
LNSLCITPVGQRAVEHIADDLHVAVAVGAEATARGDAVLVDHAQVAHAHVRRVVVAGEGEAVKAAQPAVIGVAALCRPAEGEHGASFVKLPIL